MNGLRLRLRIIRNSMEFYSWEHWEHDLTQTLALVREKTMLWLTDTLTYLRNIVPPPVPLLPGQHGGGRAALRSIQTVF